jgi:predicted RNase H-like HicB family nuclease
MAVKTYRVTLQLDESGHWIARVPDVPGCHTYGRTIHQAMERIREALSLFVRGAARANLVEDVQLPAAARERLSRVQQLRREAAARAEKAQAETVRTAKELTKKLGLSERDTARLMGISHQRVHQLVGASIPRS